MLSSLQTLGVNGKTGTQTDFEEDCHDGSNGDGCGREKSPRCQCTEKTGGALLISGTAAPLGTRLTSQPGARKSIGLVLRPGTLRNRVHVLRRFFTWLAQVCQVSFPVTEVQVLDCFTLKVQEPCNSTH